MNEAPVMATVLKPNMKVLMPTLYAIMLLMVITICYIHLQKVVGIRRVVFASCTLLYASPDARQKDFASYLRTAGARTTDITSLPHQALIKKEYILPQISITTTGRSENYEGWFAVKKFVDARFDSISRAHEGLMSLVIIATYVIIGLLSVDILRKWTLLYPIVILLCLPVLLGGCPMCSNHNQFLSLLSLVGMVMTGVLGIMVFWIGLRSAWLTGVLGILGFVAPVISAISVALEPKLCPACIIGGLMCFACGLSSQIHTRPHMPKVVKTAVIMVIGLFFVTLICVQANMSDNPTAAQTTAVDFMGRKSEDFGIQNIVQPYKCYVVSNPLCHACITAANDLRSINMNPIVISVCSVINSSQCFQWNEDSISTPIILVFNDEKRVVFQAFGWPIQNEELSSLVSLTSSHGK